MTEVRLFNSYPITTGSDIKEMTLDEAMEIQRQEANEWDTTGKTWKVPQYLKFMQGNENFWHYHASVKFQADIIVINWALAYWSKGNK